MIHLFLSERNWHIYKKWRCNVGGFFHQDQHLYGTGFGLGNEERFGVFSIIVQLYFPSCIKQIADM